MRYEGLGWDPKGTATVNRSRAGLDASGKVIGSHFAGPTWKLTDGGQVQASGGCAGRAYNHIDRPTRHHHCRSTRRCRRF